LRISLALVSVAIVIASIGCSGQGDPNPVPIIGDNNEYREVLAKADKESTDILQKISMDETLTSEDRTRLSKAASLWEGLIAYEPNKFSSYLALGMIYRGLDNPEVAERHFRQCLNLIPPSDDLAIVATVNEAHYQLSRALFDEKKYENAAAEASTAVQSDKDNPNYLTARASANIQLKNYDLAKADLKAALKLDPNHKRANSLIKLPK